MTTSQTLHAKKMESAPDRESVADVEVGNISRSIDMVPGTRLLLDQGRNSLGSSSVILSPEPSSDPEDPLNWSVLRKSISFFVVNLYSFMVAVVALSTAVTYGALIAEFHTTAEYLNVGTAVSILLVGMGNIIWNPLVSLSCQALRPPHYSDWKASNNLIPGTSLWPPSSLYLVLFLDWNCPSRGGNCEQKRCLCRLSNLDGLCFSPL